VLAGDLVLVASGDFSFGLRDRADGSLAFNSLPELDHNYADTGIPGGALVKGGDPLAALDDLAAQVKSAGIREVAGNVMVDDRLFETYRGFPDGLIAPIWVNENVIDITTTATKPGEKALVDWRPKSAAIAVEADVSTVAGDGKPITVKMLRPGVIGVSGEVAAGSAPILSIAPIAEPAAFARTAFIEALLRAGVKVAAAPLGTAGALPGQDSYRDADKVAEHVSPPLAEFTKVILKISYNRGADLMVCLAAVKSGSRNCADGLTTILKLLARHGLAESGTYVFDGAGSDDNGKTTPSDLATFLREIVTEPWGLSLRDGMAVLGVDGTQAQNGAGTPAVGHIRVKDGARVVGSAAGQGIALANTQAGYIDAKSGRKLVYGVFVNNAPFTSVEGFLANREDVATIVVAIQQGY
jgi:D-alanyl-D-alanine carboxypeptidase/D-alanyl-D-alanine-endopeptidase (penicillin-binding protein 4)